MSLKHTQFQDSPTMRSYTKIAQEKGWIQEEPLKKEASAPDYQPTANLMENVLKLCRGLRQTGFDKYAEELESKFVQFKQADCHYDVSGEKGEDLVDAAHPEGSHKLVDVEGDSVIETIVDQHMKILEKILKMPHGKLSTSAEIIDAVKVVLAQDTRWDIVKSFLVDGATNVNKAYHAADQSGELSAPTIFWASRQNNLVANLAGQDPQQITLIEINECIEAVKQLQGSFKPRFGGAAGIKNDAVWKTVNDYLTRALTAFARATSTIKMITTTPFVERKDEVSVPSFKRPLTAPHKTEYEDLQQRINSLRDRLKAFRAVLADKGAIAYLDKEEGELDTFEAGIGDIPENQKDNMKPFITKKLETFESEVTQFEQDWVKGSK